MRVSEFDFHLPPELIAQTPAADRISARLLSLNRSTGAVAHRRVKDLPDLLRQGDLLVVNDTRVFPARLLGHRVPSGGAVECQLLGWERVASETGPGSVWPALMHPGQKLKVGAHVVFERDGVVLHGEVVGRGSFGRRLVRLWVEGASPHDAAPVERAIHQIGHVPLPPYIKRSDDPADRERYQTIFAADPGSVAAPTAGLHFTDALVSRLRERGVETARITLHVGYGTFQPIRVSEVEEHRLEAERYSIGDESADRINAALASGRRVIAVGTTTTRTLESVAGGNGGRIVPGSGTTDLFIYPGFDFKVISGILTNFHLPQSSLLMLVCALAGRDHVLAAYAAAVEERYRFFSYGDAMLIL